MKKNNLFKRTLAIVLLIAMIIPLVLTNAAAAPNERQLGAPNPVIESIYGNDPKQELLVDKGQSSTVRAFLVNKKEKTSCKMILTLDKAGTKANLDVQAGGTFDIDLTSIQIDGKPATVAEVFYNPNTKLATVKLDPNVLKHEVSCAVTGGLTNSNPIALVHAHLDSDCINDENQKYTNNYIVFADKENIQQYKGTVTEGTCKKEGTIQYNLPGIMDGGGTLAVYEKTPVQPENHVWGEWEPVMRPNASIALQETRKCKDCDKTETRVINPEQPHVHDFSKLVSHQDATCQTEGYNIYRCPCGEEKKEKIAKTDHSFVVYEISFPTCEKAGMRKYKCEFCTAEKTEEYGQPLGEHIWGQWEVFKAAEPGVEGEERRYCTRQYCGKFESRPIKALPIDPDPIVPEQNKDVFNQKMNGKEQNKLYDGLEKKQFIFSVESPTKCEINFTMSNNPTYMNLTFEDSFDGKLFIDKDSILIDGTPMTDVTSNKTTIQTTEKEHTVTFNVMGNSKDITAPVMEEVLMTVQSNGLYNSDSQKNPDIPSVKSSKDPDASRTIAFDGIVGLTETTEAAEHKDATCKTEGFDKYSVLIDDQMTKDFYRFSPVNAENHQWGEWVRVKDPTTKEKGLEERICTLCGEKETREVDEIITPDPDKPEHTHQYVDKVVAPTCTEKGYTEHTCSCGASYKDNYVDALGHDYVATVINPTCTEGGCTKYKCKNCGDEYQKEETDALGHDFKIIKDVKPTCTEDGYKLERCTRCNEENKTVVKALGHDYVDTVIAPTCTKDGYTIHKCKTCGEEKRDTVVPATGHKYEVVKTVKATCTTDGYTLKKCSVCGEEVKEDIVKALGHDLTEKIVKPTCTEDGYTKVTCSRCDYEQKKDIVKATGHNYTKKVVEATCTEDGYTLKTCETCGHKEKVDIVEAKGHDYKETITKEPTCTEKGEKKLECKNCDHTKTEEIAAKGHDWGKWSEIIPEDEDEKPTKEQRKCKVCGEKETRKIGEGKDKDPKLGFEGTSEMVVWIVIFSLSVIAVAALGYFTFKKKNDKE